MPEPIDGEDYPVFNVGSAHIFDREPEDREERVKKIPFGFQAPAVSVESKRAKKRKRRRARSKSKRSS